MRLKARKVTRASGAVEYRMVLELTADEAENAPRIADDCLDPHFHRTQGDSAQQADWILMQARLLAFWAGTWEQREQHWRFITQAAQKRRKPAARSRKRRRKSR